jgi:type IV pilus assembly protein PilA
MKRQHGFTLIELTVVIAITLVLITTLYPLLLGARRTANETAAIGSLRSVVGAEMAYASRNGSQYASKLADLATAGYLDSRFNSAAPITGYLFQEGNTVSASIPPTVPLTAPMGFAFSSTPNTPTDGSYNFAVGGDGVIYYGNLAPAGLTGQPVR